MSHDTGHQAPGGYPPAAGTETDAIDGRDVTAAKPFASLTTRDYVTDAVAAVLLLVSLSLTWRLPSFAPQPASDVAWALPVTLLALAALVLPYLARLGAFPGSWSVHTTRRWRLLLTAPYGLAVLAQIVLDVIPGDRLEGVGAAVAVGLAGAVLAASPRTSEVGPVEQDASGANLGRTLARLLTFLALAGLLGWLVYFIVGWTQLAERDQERLGGVAWLALSLVAVLALVAIVFIPLVLGGLGRAVAWQRVLIAVAVAAVVLFFVQGSSTNVFAKFETIRTWRDGFPVIATGFGLVLLPGAAAALAAPVAARARRAADDAGSWFRTARSALVLHASVTLLLAVATIAALVVVDDLAVAPQVAHAVVLLVSGALALVAASALRKDVVERRGTVLVLTVLAAVAGITAMSQVSGNEAIGPMPVNVLSIGYLLIALALPILVVLALTVPTVVREFFAAHPRAPRADSRGAYEWRPASRPAYEAHGQAQGAPSQHGDQSYGYGAPAANVAAAGAAAPGYGASTGYPAAEQSYPAAAEPSYPPAAGAPSTASPDTAQVDGYGQTPVEAPAQPVEPAPATQPVVEQAEPEQAPVLDDDLDHDTVLKVDRSALPSADTTAVFDPIEEPVAEAPAAHGFTAAQAADPATSAHTLAQIVQDAPELRAAVASNPTTYPALLEWLGQLGDPDVDAALKSRQG